MDIKRLTIKNSQSIGTSQKVLSNLPIGPKFFDAIRPNLFKTTRLSFLTILLLMFLE